MADKRKSVLYRILGKAMETRLIPKLIEPFRLPTNKIAALATRQSNPQDTPWTPFKKPLRESTIAVVNTAGIHLDGQLPFDIDALKGDPTFREMPSDFDKSRLRITHVHYSHARFNEDPNVILPIDRLRELVANGVLAGLGPRFYSFGFGGGITKEYIDKPNGTAHLLAKQLLADRVDALLMIPA